MNFQIHSEEYEGFTIATYALPEMCNPVDLGLDDETVENINRGNLEWFCAKVSASMYGIELASEYLGACCYPSSKDFIKDSDYYEDMRKSVVQMAKENIRELARGVELD